MKKAPLKRTKRLNPVSLKKIRQMQAEVPERIALCNRAKGITMLGKHTYYVNGKGYPVTTVQCYNGLCECSCGQRGELHPHERVYRSHGGKVSLDNSIMILNKCHGRLQNNEPKWTRTGEANTQARKTMPELQEERLVVENSMGKARVDMCKLPPQAEMIKWGFKCLGCGYKFTATEPIELYHAYNKCRACGSTNFRKEMRK